MPIPAASEISAVSPPSVSEAHSLYFSLAVGIAELEHTNIVYRILLSVGQRTGTGYGIIRRLPGLLTQHQVQGMVATGTRHTSGFPHRRHAERKPHRCRRNIRSDISLRLLLVRTGKEAKRG